MTVGGKRGPKGPHSASWKPGQSGNPKGYPAPMVAMSKAVARYIAERTNNGFELVDRLIELGLEAPANNAAEKRIAIAAVLALLERGAGKSATEVTLTMAQDLAGPRRLRTLTDEDLAVLGKLDLEEPDLITGEPTVDGLNENLRELEAGVIEVSP